MICLVCLKSFSARINDSLGILFNFFILKHRELQREFRKIDPLCLPPRSLTGYILDKCRTVSKPGIGLWYKVCDGFQLQMIPSYTDTCQVILLESHCHPCYLPYQPITNTVLLFVSLKTWHTAFEIHPAPIYLQFILFVAKQYSIVWMGHSSLSSQ